MIRSIVIDDEINSRDLLTKMITRYCEGVMVGGAAVDVPSGIQLIKELKPDLIFLDIEMPGGDGFSLLRAFNPIPFKIIFVTGYDHYAIQAIKYAALDYLLKPIALNDLKSAIQRAQTVINHQTDHLRFLSTQLHDSSSTIGQILLPVQSGHLIVNWQEIIKIEAEGNYVFFHLANGSKHLVAYPLSYYEELLPPTLFFRIHKSYIINCKKVTRIENGRGGNVHFEDGSCLAIAARRKKAFLNFYKKKSESRS